MPRLVLISLSFFYFTSTLSQQLQVESYTPARGLLDTRVIKIFQDNRGLLYFLTWEGISIFDGLRFTNINEYNGESLGLVNDMIQWEKDTCYVFTFQRGVYKLIHNRLIKDNRFDKITEPNHVLTFAGNHFIITSNTGLFRWDGSAAPLPLFNSNGQTDPVDAAVIKNNWLVYSKNSGSKLCLYNLAVNTVTDSITNTRIASVTGGAGFPVWASANGKWIEFNTDSLLSGKLKPQPLSFQTQLPAGFSVSNIHTAKHKLWLEDPKKGYLLLHTETGQKEFYPAVSGLQPGASVLFADKENNYWFALFSKQVQKAFYTQLKRVYTNMPASITGVHTDEYGEAFTPAGTKLYLLQPDNSFQPTYTHREGTNGFYWQGRSWIFKTSTVIESEKGETIDLLKNQEQNLDPDMTFTGRISYDKEGRLLIPGVNFFIIEKNGTVHAARLPSFTDNIVVDADNTYHAFGRSGDISSVSLTKNGIQKNTVHNTVNIGGPRFAMHWNKDTFCIGTRHQGIIWLVLQNGKARVAGKLNASKGLSNNFVSGLVRKNEQQFYAATGFGLDEITIGNKDTTIQNLSAANNIFLPFSFVIKNRNNEILAYSNDRQLWSVSDINQSPGGFVPAAWFSEIAVNGNSITDSVHSFAYNQNNFRFTVSAPCFINASNTRFYFLLENETGKWEQQSAENFYSINNLSAGRYTLTVTIKYPGKIYPDKKIVYSFLVKAPIWKRPWVIMSGILLAALLLGGIIRSYYRRKLAAQKAAAEKRKAIEKERNRISRDMHDDLGSGLTKIAILSEVAKKQLPEPEKAREQLEKISASSRELVDNLQDIIWVLNPKNDTLESLAAYIREYTLKFLEPLSIAGSFRYPEQFTITHLSEEKRRNIFLTVKESLHNIAKHAWCNSVVISITESAGSFMLIIQDDGKGFDSEKVRNFANGLKNMQARIEQSNGRYELITAPAKGTTIKISMPV